MVIFFLSLYLTRRLGFTPPGQVRRSASTAWIAGRAYSEAGFGPRRLHSVQKWSLTISGVFLIALGQVRSAAGILPLLFIFRWRRALFIRPTPPLWRESAS